MQEAAKLFVVYVCQLWNKTEIDCVVFGCRSIAFLQVAGFWSVRFKMSNSFNQIVSEKLDKNNYPAWKFRMTNFLKGKGYWDFIKGDNENALTI